MQVLPQRSGSAPAPAPGPAVKPLDHTSARPRSHTEDTTHHTAVWFSHSAAQLAEM